MRKHFYIVLLFLLPGALFAQFKIYSKPMSLKENLSISKKPVYIADIFGLDSDRFSMQHSYSMSYMTGGQNGYTQGLYLNTLSYQFAIPLSVSVQLGYAHQPFQGANTSPILQNGMFLSGAKLRYEPNEKTVIQFEYNQRPFQNNPWMYSRYRDPFNSWDNGF